MKLEKITLIRPNMGAYRSKDALTPLSIGILAARTPKDIELSFFDERVEELLFEDIPDLVAITVETFTANRAYEIAEVYRKKGISVVMGGYHPTLLPEEVLEHADSIVVGDAEGLWENLLEDFKNDKLQKQYNGSNTKKLDDYTLDRSIYEGKNYLPVELIQYSRGCRFTCEFCSIHAFYKQTLRVRPIGGYGRRD